MSLRIFTRTRRAQIPGTQIDYPRAGGPSLIDKGRLLLRLFELKSALTTRMKKSSWKTSIGGLLTAAGAAMASSTDGVVHIIGQVLTILGPIILGLAARDNKVTSEQADAG